MSAIETNVPEPPPLPPVYISNTPRGLHVVSDEWISVQKKTFTNWCNFQLKQFHIPDITDLLQDLSDGVLLIKLIEIVVGEKFPEKFNGQPKSTSQKLENISNVLKYLESKGLRLVNIHPEDILNGNEKLILGLIWTLIRHFIQQYAGQQYTTGQGILNWVKVVVPADKAIYIDDLSKSWWNGKALYALAQKLNPDLKWINKSPVEMLTRAITEAEKYGIPPIIDPRDVADSLIDDRSMMSYLAFFPGRVKTGKRPKSQLENRKRILERTNTKQKLLNELSDVRKKLEEKDWLIMTQSNENHEREVAQLEKEIEQKQKELEIEKLKKRLDELQEWKIQIEENGLEESLTDIDLSLSSDQIQKKSLTKQTKRLVLADINKIKDRLSEEHNKKKDEELNKQAAIWELKQSEWIREKEQLESKLKDQEKVITEFRNKPAVKIEPPVSPQRIVKYEEPQIQQQIRELTKAVRSRGFDGLFDLPIQQDSKIFIDLKDAIMTASQGYEGLIERKYNQTIEKLKQQLQPIQRLTIIEFEIEKTLDALLKYLTEFQREKVIIIYQSEEILIQSLLDLVQDFNNALSKISNNQNSNTARLIVEVKQFRSTRGQLLKSLLSQQNDNSILESNFGDQNEQWKILLKFLVLSVLPAREKILFIGDRIKGDLDDLVTSKSIAKERSVQTDLQELTDQLKNFVQYHNKESFKESSPSNSNYNRSTTNQLLHYISILQEYITIPNLSMSSMGFSQRKSINKSGFLSNKQESKILVNSGLLKDQIEQIQTIVTLNNYYCDYCKRSKKELEGLKLLVKELTDMRDKFDVSTKQEESFANETEPILQNTLTLQSENIHQMNIIADGLQEKLRRKGSIFNSHSNQFYVWFLLLLEAFLLLFLSLLLIPPPIPEIIRLT